MKGTVEVRLERRGKALVAVPLEPVPTLTNEMVQKFIDKMREERGMVCQCDECCSDLPPTAARRAPLP